MPSHPCYKVNINIIPRNKYQETAETGRGCTFRNPLPRG
nr:MAG TPA: hypothetical protein [Siphoviridae sp. ct7JV2]